MVDREISVGLVDQCACCRGSIGSNDRSEHCSRCRWHQRLYGLIVFAAFCGLVWIGRSMGTIAFGLAPFAGKALYLAIVFGLALAGPLVFVLAISLARSEAHAHWGSAVHHKRSDRGSRTVFRNGDYGHALTAQLGIEAHTREIREPRCTWKVIIAFLAVVPAASATLAWFHYDRTRFVVYVDNGTEHELTIAVVGHGTIGEVPAGGTEPIRLPRAALTLVATSDGDDIERVTVGGLDQILAGDYPELFPDIEHDTADVFIWNVQRQRCYQSSTKTYGSISFGSAPTMHREKTFISDAEVPFERAPGSVESSLPFDVRTELIRVPCE